jgi:hypothetical protein
MSPQRVVYYPDTSPWSAVRIFCRCPHCGVMWEHFETQNIRHDEEWMKQRYGWVTRCQNCGGWSEARNHFISGVERHRIPPPQPKPTPQPQTKTTRKPPKPPFWARTRKPRPVKERDHACEEER